MVDLKSEVSRYCVDGGIDIFDDPDESPNSFLNLSK